jgi:hypothetical protein
MTVTPVLATAGAEAKEVKPGASAVAFVAWPLLLAMLLIRICAGPAG